MSEDPQLDQRLRRMFSGRAEAVESHLSGPALRARAARRPSAVRRYAPPVVAAAAVAALAVGLALAGSGDGNGPPAPVGGSVPPATVVSRPSHPRPKPTPRSSRPLISSTHLPAPGRLESPSVPRGKTSTAPVRPGTSRADAPAIPRRSAQLSRTVAAPPS